MLSPVCTLLALALGSISARAQNLPTERPKGCDGSNCVGCTPFQPPEASSKDYPCGINDIYFPVPIYAIRNDTSVGREVESRQWACFACCTLGCGFDDPQNTCAYTKYEWEEGNKYGCTKCAGKDVSVKGGEVKTSLADMSTQSIYTTLVTPYGACAPKEAVASIPPPEAPILTPSPPAATVTPPATPPATPAITPPATPVPTPSPPSIPVATEPPASPVLPPVVAQAPALDVEVADTPAPAAEAPDEFVPIEIGSTTGPVESSALMAGAGAVSAAVAAMWCIA